MAGVNRWVALLASACRGAVEDAGWFEASVRELQVSWVERVGPTRRDSTVRHLIQVLPGMPVLSNASAARATDRSFQATSQAVKRLTDAGVLRQITVGRRNRAFEAPELIDTFTALERRLDSPRGDARVAQSLAGRRDAADVGAALRILRREGGTPPSGDDVLNSVPDNVDSGVAP